MKLRISLAVMAVSAWAMSHAAPVVPVKLAAPPRIDGDLSDPAWQSAQKLAPFVKYNKNEPAQFQTAAYIGYDDRALYIAVVCPEPQTDKLVTRAKLADGKDHPLHRDDSVEIFISPGAPGKYYHYIVTANNVRLDQRVSARTQSTAEQYAWSGAWQSATRVVPGQEWVAEIAIPWSDLAQDLGPGDWAINICRSKQTEPKEYAAYSFPDGKFNQNFAPLARPALDLAYLTQLQVHNVQVPEYLLDEQGYGYRVEGMVVSRATNGQAVILELWDCPDSGQPARTTAPLMLKAQAGTPFSVPVRCADIGPRTLRLRISEADTQRPLLATGYGPDIYPWLLQAYFDRNYYTTEKEARAIFQLNLPALKGAFKARAEIAVMGGKSLQQEQPVQDLAKTVVPFAVADIPDGTWAAALSLLDGQGRVVATNAFVVRKLPPPPPGVREVKVDHERLTVLVNNQPFFMISICWKDVDYLPLLAEAGFNTSYWWGGSGRNPDLKNAKTADEKNKLLTGFLDASHALGLSAIALPHHFSSRMTKAGRDYTEKFPEELEAFSKEELPGIMEVWKKHPALIAYYGPDEPNCGPASFMHEACGKYLNAIRELDPYKPTEIVFCGPYIEYWPEYDIAGMDNYNIYRKLPMITVYKGVLSESLRLHRYRRVPNWHVPLLESCPPYGEQPTTEGIQQAQTYLTVIARANGILWFRWPPYSAGNWKAMQRLAKELRALEPVLTEDNPVQFVKYDPADMEDSVKVLVKNHAGKTYLLTCNAMARPCRAQYQLPAGYDGTAKVWFENRTVKVEAGRLADEYAGHGRHVYELDGEWPWRGSLKLKVESGEASPEAAVKAAPEPQAGNLIQDGGFETPDYWKFDSGDEVLRTVTGALTEENVLAGKKTAMIKRPHAEGQSRYKGWMINLDPNTRYIFGGCAMSVGGQAALVLRSPTQQLAAITVPDRSFWQKYSTIFDTGDAPVVVEPLCTFTGVGTAWFDNLFLRKAGKSANLLANSGFEKEWLPGWPDKWVPLWHLEKPASCGDPQGTWTSDTNQFYEGRCSMRLGRNEEIVQRRTGAAGPYMFTAYLKAADTNTVAQLDGLFVSKLFPVSTAWKRYVLPVQYARDGMQYYTIRCKGGGPLWIDAVQVEAGTNVTDYSEAPEE